MDLCLEPFYFGSFPLKDYFAVEIDTDELITNYSDQNVIKWNFIAKRMKDENYS